MQLINIQEFNELVYPAVPPMYILVAGGIAAGKSHVVNKFINTPPYVVVDVDHFMSLYNYTNYNKNSSEWSQAMEATGAFMSNQLDSRKSVVSQGTGANLNWVQYRLNDARSRGYRTGILHIYAPLEQLYAQNKMRKQQGKRYIPDSEMHLIKETAAQASFNVSFLEQEKSPLVDFICKYDNGSGV